MGGNDEFTTGVSDQLSVKFNAMQDELNTRNSVLLAAHVKQDEVKSLLDQEQTRLNTKKNQIDTAIENQKRIIYFNEDNRKKSAAYLKISITVAISLLVIFGLYSFAGYFFPQYVVYLLIIAVGVIGGVFCIQFYFTIRSRDNYNFDETKFDTLPLPGENDKDKSSNNGSLSFDTSCIGQDCCDTPGLKWNNDIGKCVSHDGFIGYREGMDGTFFQEEGDISNIMMASTLIAPARTTPARTTPAPTTPAPTTPVPTTLAPAPIPASRSSLQYSQINPTPTELNTLPPLSKVLSSTPNKINIKILKKIFNTSFKEGDEGIVFKVGKTELLKITVVKSGMLYYFVVTFKGKDRKEYQIKRVSDMMKDDTNKYVYITLIIDKEDLKMHWNQDKDIIVEYTPLNNKKDWTNHWETMTKPSIIDVKNNRSPFFSIY
jgi:hypothetical protein